METKRWNLPYREGWITAERGAGVPVMALTLVNEDEQTLHTLTAYGAEYIRHLADIFTAVANFAEGTDRPLQ